MAAAVWHISSAEQTLIPVMVQVIPYGVTQTEAWYLTKHIYMHEDNQK